MWPRFLIDSGRVKIYTTDSRVIADEAFAEKDIGPDEKFAEWLFVPDVTRQFVRTPIPECIRRASIMHAQQMENLN